MVGRVPVALPLRIRSGNPPVVSVDATGSVAPTEELAEFAMSAANSTPAALMRPGVL
jgi:hypothetical protein